MSSISNFVTFLNTMPKKAQVSAPSEPGPITPDDVRLLQLIGTATLLSPPDLVKLSGITPAEATTRVERLRALNQVELVERTEAPGTLFLRLTSGGYASLKA